MKIGVSGASGKLGRAIVAALLRHGFGGDLVGISRTPATLPMGIAARFGDYDSPESLAAAYVGIERLLLIPTMDLRSGQRRQQNLAAIAAAVAAGVGHICFMSSAGTRRAAEPDIWASYFPAEQYLMQSAPVWSILRMNYYIEALLPEVNAGLARGFIAGIGDGRVGYVSRDDLALAAAGLLSGEGHEGAIYTGTGPAALSGTEKAAVIAQLTGRPIRYVDLSVEAFRAGLAQANLPPDIAAAVVSIQSRFAAGGFDIVTGDIERLAGQKPRALHAVLGGILEQQ